MLHPTNKRTKGIGEKSADFITSLIGSWTFILLFILFSLAWIELNVYAWNSHWDPYPFILLNLVLACLTAIEVPIILMSQNRESQKSTLRAEYDYAVNRKAEKEIRDLKEQLSRIEKFLKR